MTTEEDEDNNIDLLVDQLNDLLHTLDIRLSIPVESPTDLTPSLLIAILESLLGTRLAVEAYTYTDLLTPRSSGKNVVDRMNRIQSMKIFLGVLEHDVLGMDVGLSDVDPRRLARGEWEEVVYVAEVLGWVGVQLREVYDRTPLFDGLLPYGKQESTTAREGDEEDDETIGLGIYEECCGKWEGSYKGGSPSLLSNDLSSDVELNASFTVRVPSVCCSECGGEQDRLEAGCNRGQGGRL